jgi:hypothetical protein
MNRFLNKSTNFDFNVLDDMLVQFLGTDGIFQVREIYLILYLKSIKYDDYSSDILIGMLSNHSNLYIVKSINLGLVPLECRHDELCLIKCREDIRELNYVPDKICTKIWRSLLNNPSANFTVNYQLRSNGNTLLMYAVEYGWYDEVCKLLNQGAYINLLNHKNQSVFDFISDNTNNKDKIYNILSFCKTRDLNNYKYAKITPDRTCYNQRESYDTYSCGSGSGSGGGGDDSPSIDDCRYSEGYVGRSPNNCGAIYCGNTF